MSEIISKYNLGVKLPDDLVIGEFEKRFIGELIDSWRNPDPPSYGHPATVVRVIRRLLEDQDVIFAGQENRNSSELTDSVREFYLALCDAVEMKILDEHSQRTLWS